MLETKVTRYTRELFETWEASEIKLEDYSKAFYMLKDPNSEYQKVCMFVDGYRCMIYGDYGSYMFNNMTWVATPHNLRYDDLDYQLEKMDNVSKKHAAYIFDSDECDKDILNWLKNILELEHNMTECDFNKISIILEELRDSVFFVDECEVSSYLIQNGFDSSLTKLVKFAYDAMQQNGSRKDFFAFLNYNYDELIELDYSDYSDLWEAGIKLSDRFLTSMYAMEVCGKKLKERELAEIEEERE